MKMKKVFSWMLMAALGVGLGMSVASCKDDDKDDNGGSGGGEQTEEQTDVTQKYWDVVGQLVGIGQYTEDYQDKTFEPTIGEAESEGSLTRVVLVNDLETAARRFANLIGATGIDENTPSYTYDDPDVGTLTYTRNGNAQAWATVDVNIKQVPHLKKIVYRTIGDENGSFSGKAYFRFGDIVKRQVDGTDEYWICVRPAFGPEKKEDSHWVCLNYLPAKNTKTVNGSNGCNYFLPTAIGTDKENMQNLAEMLYAIFNPTTWRNNAEANHTDGKVFGYDGVPIFSDFQAKNLKYHNQYFWQNVQAAWEGKAEVAQAFGGLSYAEVKKMMTTGYNNSGPYLHLLYKGYSWYTTFSWNLTLYEANYKIGSGETCNMHAVEYKEHEENVKAFTNVFDCATMPIPVNDYNQFWKDNHYRFFVRHATGKELNGGNTLNVKAGFDGGTGVTEVYRYYATYSAEWSKNTGDLPEVTTDQASEGLTNVKTDGQGYYMPGDVVKDEQGNRWFCIAGSPYGPYAHGNDHYARFITFDFNGINTSGNTVDGLPTADEAIDLALHMQIFINQLMQISDVNYQYNPTTSNPKLGRILEHIKQFAGVNLDAKLVTADSTFTFTDRNNNTFDSRSRSPIWNIAYNDGNNTKQAILRVIYDNTQAGNKRSECIAKNGKRLQDWHYRVYQHYEHFDPAQTREFKEEESQLGMTKWNLPWAMTTDKICLQDIASADMVTRHAKDDKWVTLPLYKSATEVGPRRTPRTQAVASVYPKDCIGADNDNRAGMFNESVWFVRIMKVEDNGGTSKKPNLTSTDGRKLTVVHMQDDAWLYNSTFQGIWCVPWEVIIDSDLFFLDNRVHKLPLVDGWGQ